MSTPESPDPRVTKRAVTMSDPLPFIDPISGRETVGAGVRCTDYVRPDFLDAYVADALTRWGSVEVSDAPDAGPGGYDGPTYVPHGLDHPAAGTWHPANAGHPLAGVDPPAEATAIATPEA